MFESRKRHHVLGDLELGPLYWYAGKSLAKRTLVTLDSSACGPLQGPHTESAMTRPEQLPDFSHPPLDEVVLGVQFASIPGYSSVDSKAVWDLFRSDFPTVEEHPILAPQFETFGGGYVQAGPHVIVGVAPVGSRLWFVSEQSNHLIQFQSDRFIRNWRRRASNHSYPRFEGLSESMELELRRLADYCKTAFSYEMNINQAEVSYVNIIKVSEFREAESWFSLWHGAFDVEGLNISFGEIIRTEDGKPYARLGHQIQSVFAIDGKQKAFQLSLTFRGKPAGSGIEAAMKFLSTGRDMVVNRFLEVTTAQAHEVWGRLR